MPTFDISPQVYAEPFHISPRTALRVFKKWHEEGKPFIVHPSPGIYRMDREHFDRMLRNGVTKATTVTNSAR